VFATPNFRRSLAPGLAVALLGGTCAKGAGTPDPVAAFKHDVSPILEDYCYECHGDGMSRGKVAFDDLSDADIRGRTDLWFTALKNLRAGIMPPAGKPHPTPAEEKRIVDWIKYSAFGIDPADPDPGRVTIRRLNRVEYGRTVRALLGVDYPSEAEFPPDDTGNGFDNIGDVLSLSPLLLEKYLQAADTIITGVVPQTSRVTPVVTATGRDFRDFDPARGFQAPEGEDGGRPARPEEGRPIPYAETLSVGHVFKVTRDAKYQVAFNLGIKGPFNFDPSRCRLVVTIDGETCHDEPLGWFDHRTVQFSRDEDWKAGPHEVVIAMSPLSPAMMPPGAEGPDPEDKQHLEVRIESVQVRGPFDPASRVLPADYLRFFPKGEPPASRSRRDGYAREILRDFASRAFRRPVDDVTLTRLVNLAHEIDAAPGGTFEAGISRAMMAILASPRFVFRIERPDPADAGARFPRVDEYTLAARLSYFLWSTMPDAELLALAAKGQLRANLHAQVARMLLDKKSEGLVRNFTGQWLQARDVEFVPINARVVLGLGPPVRGGPKVDFDGDTRRAMRSETEMVFDYIMHGDRSVLELVDSDYTFLNERLAKVYGIDGVAGKSMRLVSLPPDSLRGGVLTEGTVLTVTSNPTRTSPVKRGQFVLENILGTPVPPPPPNIPALEAAKSAFPDHEPTLREMLAVHRSNKLCQSCHARMDSVGLAFENFNALGNYRTTDAGQPIDTLGKLISGEQFADVRELKRVITHARRDDFYRCLTEKLMTYALGRGLEYYDVESVDRIVASLDGSDGRFSSLLMGIIDSPPFQRQRVPGRTGLMARASAASPAKFSQ
jgi:uncharacterized protein DUF1592/uncharacterized protein DUF1588/uncharacterized protein DUF1585/uncharacterized protein DUF1587/uncharacterized protein DUF1595/cbb3-type cytochrome c oxidase subunit III